MARRTGYPEKILLEGLSPAQACAEILWFDLKVVV